MRALITGISGFVGTYLSELLKKQGVEVWGTTKSRSSDIHSNVYGIDLHDEESLLNLINDAQPDYIFHLAGQSSVKLSWDSKIDTFQANVIGTICLYEAIRKSRVACRVRVLSVGSSEEYGKVPTIDMPIREEVLLNPISPYGVSKASMYMVSKHYHMAYDMQIIHVRPFNHIGPRQERGFVAADFAYQVAMIEKGLLPTFIEVGNLSSERDFLDVRDIVKTYFHIIQNGIVGHVYNISSGTPTRISNLLEYYLSMASVKISISVRDDLIRPIDTPLYLGSNQKLVTELGWKQTISLQESLQDILDYWRSIT